MTTDELLKEREKELRCLYGMCLLAAQAPGPAEAARGVAQSLVRAMRNPSRTECSVDLACEPEGARMERRAGACGEALHAIEAAVLTREEAGSSRWRGSIALRSSCVEDFLEQEKSLLASVANVLAAMLETQVMIGDLASKNAALRELVSLVENERRRALGEMGERISGGILPLVDKVRSAGGDAARRERYLSMLERDLESETSARVEASGLFARLSPREREIAAHVRRGLTSKEIAALLGISMATVERHRHNIRKKLGVDRSESDLARVLGM